MPFWEKNDEIVQEEEVERPNTKRGKFKRHIKKYWWIHLIVFIVINIIGVLIAVYVAYPAIAQNGVSEATLQIVRQEISNPTPNSLDANIETLFLSKLSLAPEISSFNAAMYLAGHDVPCYNVTVPTIPRAGNGTTVHIKQRINITNEDEFSQYALSQVLTKNFTVHLVGKTPLQLGGLPQIHVDFNQSVVMEGLNNLEGIAVTNLTLLTKARPDGVNAVGAVMVPNPTSGTFGLGDASVAQFVNGTFIANSTIKNLVLRPGNNTYPIESTTDPLAVAKLLLRPEYRNGILPIDIVGVKSVYQGQEIPYFTTALQANLVKTELNIWDAVADTGQSWVGQLMDLVPALRTAFPPTSS